MKKLIFMSGIPGSGKTYLAKELRKQFEDEKYSCNIVSTDNFFLKDGKYCFDYTKIGLNHDKARRHVQWFMQDQINIVILDNTNITLKEYKPYLLLALLYGYSIEIISPEQISVEDAFNRNSHEVPIETIQRMNDNKINHDVVYTFFNNLKKTYNE